MKTVGSIYGKADRCTYQLGDVTVRIDRLHKAIHGDSTQFVWQIRESQSHAKKRADESGGITFPHVHVSTIKLKDVAWTTVVDGTFKTHGKALASAIQYLNQKRKGGEI